MGSRDSEDRWERWVRKTLSGKHLKDAPAPTLRRAIALGSQLSARPSGLAGWLVELLFDSAAQPLPAGLRSVASDQRRLLYRGRTGPDDEVQLDLRLRRESRGTLEVTGQFLPPWNDAHVQATAGRTRKKKELSEAGEFVLKGLAGSPSTLRLEIHAGDEKLVIDDIPLPPLDAEPS